MKIVETLKHLAADFVESWKWLGHALAEQFAYDTSPEAEAIRQWEQSKRDAERAREDAAKARQAQQQMMYLATQNYNANVVPYVQLEAFRVVYRAHSRLGAIQPFDVQQVPARSACKGGALVTKVIVARAETPPVLDGSLRVVGDVFQQEMEQDLRAGLVEGANVPSIDGRTPLLFVDDVMVSGSYYIITIGVADTPAMVRRYWSRRMPRPTPPPAVPFDDLV